MKSKFHSSRLCPALFTICLGMSVAGIHSVQAATEIQYANPAGVFQTVSSTIGSADLTVADGTAYAVGDIIRFTNANGNGSPFGGATNFYIISVVGNVLNVATTPGGAAALATVAVTVAETQLSQSISNPANWTGGDAPDTNSESALFNSPTGSVPAFITTADQTLYGIRQIGSGSDLTLASGANGTGLYTLTFATDDLTTPKISGESSSRVISLGSTAANASPLVILGAQGLSFNSRTPGAATGTGTDAVSGNPPKQTRLWNVDWSGLTGDIEVERGELSTRSSAGTFPNHNLTVGNAQTVTNNILAGLTMATGTTVQALNGNSLGRVFGNNTLIVGNNDAAGGDFAGVIGRSFPGDTNTTNVTKTGFGDQTISGVMGGTGTLNANQGILNLTGTVEDAAALLATGGWLNIDGIVGGTGQVNANSGLLSLNSANHTNRQTVINNGGLLAIGDSAALGGALAPNTVLDITTTDTSTAATVAPGSYLVIGTSVTGFGIPVNTVVTAYDRVTGAVTLNNAAVSTGTTSGTFDGIQMATTTGVATVFVTIGTPIVPGMSVTGSGIASDTLVNSYDSITGIVTLNKNATADGVVIGTFAGSTNINTGGTLDLNGQSTAERIINVSGVIINNDTVNPAELISELVDLGNPTFDGPGDITVNDIIRNAGVTRRTFKNGTGSLTLAGDQSNNRYGLTVNGGDVILAKTAGEAVNRFPLIMNNASSTVTLTVTSDQIGNQTDVNGLQEINAGTLDLNGFDEGFAALSTSTGAEPGGIVTNSDGGTTSTLTLLGANVDATWPGAITGNLNLVKNGTNIQTLNGASSYTGFTQISGGTLVIGDVNALGTSIIGGGNASFTGTLDVNGFAIANTIADKVISGGTITNTGAAVDLTGMGTFGATATRSFNVDGTGDITFGQVITGAYSIVKNGANTLTLNGVNTYVGSTTVNAGSLALDGDALLDSTSLIIDGTGTVAVTGTGDEVVNTLFIGGTQVNMGTWGSGTYPEITAGTITVLTGPASSDYDTWAALYTPADLTNMAGDNDNDGLTNQQEYAYGLSPVDGSSVNPYIAANLSGGTFTYQRRATTGLTYTVETSTDLAIWTPDLTAMQDPTTVGDNQSVLVTPTGPLPSTKFFVRIKAD